MLLITIASSLMLYWIYDGYGRFLYGMAAIRRAFRASRERKTADTPHQLPPVTVLLTVHNEAAVIQSRIRNLLEASYPSELLKIVVASDGSTDSTNDLVRAYPDSRVRLFESPGLGKTATQNAAIREIQSEIVAFTDADIQFDRNWIHEVVQRFTDPSVGAVDGRLLYGSATDNAVQASQGAYWKYELQLRQLESELGILAIVAGAGFAIRRSLFVDMDPAIGEDCIVPLDIVSQGFRVVHEPKALAWDSFESDSSITWRRRIRMTLRNWQGTWSRKSLLNPLRHPGYAFALWSHKILRWMSPIFLGSATIASTISVCLARNVLSITLFVPFLMLFVFAACGWWSARRQIRIPGTGTAFTFVLVNAAFLIGILRAVAGQQIRSYRNAA